MKTLKITLASLILLSGLFMTACKKNHAEETDIDTSGATDNALAENTSNDIDQIGSQAVDEASLSSYRIEGAEILTCANVTKDSVAKTITVEFNGSVCLDGRTRSGTVTFNFSASAPGAKHYRDPGFSCTVTSSNYVVDGHQVNIVNKTVTNTTPAGFDSSVTNETWHITANINIVKAGGATISWNCDRVKTLLNTKNTYRGKFIPIDWPHAIIGITGTASGTRANGESFTVNITSQLVRDFNCTPVGSKRHPFINGTLEFTPGSKATRYVDYGAPSSGACDNLADVTINGKVHHITLP